MKPRPCSACGETVVGAVKNPLNTHGTPLLHRLTCAANVDSTQKKVDMTMTAPDLVDPFEDIGPPRDRYGRPRLIPAGGGERTAFTRMSALAGYVCDDFGLSTWTQRLLAIGLGRREDLRALIAALPELNDAQCSTSSLSKAQKEQDVATKKKLDEYIELALEAAGRNYKANYGSAVHGMIEKGSSDGASDQMRTDVDSCLSAFREHGIEIVATEQFVANDALRAAGSFDYLLRTPRWGVILGDCKTGKVDGKGLQFAVQMSGYVDGDLYDWHDDTRRPLESLTAGEAVNRDVGLLVHVPLGGAKTVLKPVNLVAGRKAALQAVAVRDLRDRKDYLGPELVTS